MDSEAEKNRKKNHTGIKISSALVDKPPTGFYVTSAFLFLEWMQRKKGIYFFEKRKKKAETFHYRDSRVVSWHLNSWISVLQLHVELVVLTDFSFSWYVETVKQQLRQKHWRVITSLPETSGSHQGHIL